VGKPELSALAEGLCLDFLDKLNTRRGLEDVGVGEPDFALVLLVSLSTVFSMVVDMRLTRLWL
jgi:hypothetical protein